MRKNKRGQVHHHKIFVAVILAMSFLYVFSTVTAEAAVALPKPFVTVVSSLAKVGESKKVVIVATAIAPNGNPVEKLSITLDGKTQTCTKSYYCRVSFGPFKITKNKVLTYTATATYKSGTKSISAIQKKSLTVVKEKKVVPASIVPVAPVVLDQGRAENIPAETTGVVTNNSNLNANNQKSNNNSVNDDATKARDAQRVDGLKQLQTILDLYYKDNNNYPGGNNVILGVGDHACLNSDGWDAVGCPYPYITEIPQDFMFGYVYNSDGTSYTVDTQLEGVVDGFSGKIRMSPSGINKL